MSDTKNNQKDASECCQQSVSLACIEKMIVIHRDFPKQGILFRDVMPILSDANALKSLIDHLANKLTKVKFDMVIGIEARGFLFGPLLAQKLNLPFVPIRKKGKLPGDLLSLDYKLEYGTDTLQIQRKSLQPKSKCLLVDDLLATGGSMSAAKTLVEGADCEVVACIVIIELKKLNGKQRLGSTPCFELFSY